MSAHAVPLDVIQNYEASIDTALVNLPEPCLLNSHLKHTPPSAPNVLCGTSANSEAEISWYRSHGC